MTESEAIEILRFAYPREKNRPVTEEVIRMAVNALEKQEKIKEIISNSNQWSKEDVVVKAQAFCDIEKIVRSDVD